MGKTKGLIGILCGRNNQISIQMRNLEQKNYSETFFGILSMLFVLILRSQWRATMLFKWWIMLKWIYFNIKNLFLNQLEHTHMMNSFFCKNRFSLVKQSTLKLFSLAKRNEILLLELSNLKNPFSGYVSIFLTFDAIHA